MLFVLALVTFLLAAFFWRDATAPFIRQGDESSDADYAGVYLSIFVDFFKAIVIGKSYGRKIPLGVFLHGFFLLATVVALVVAWSLE
jgi:hypothetical protein